MKCVFSTQLIDTVRQLGLKPIKEKELTTESIPKVWRGGLSLKMVKLCRPRCEKCEEIVERRQSRSSWAV